uniref:Uncharacterized protein n=1 Tax=Clastoptera arizonana TaxID=38151 RepID=A0A1B6DDX8_9HEMI
MSTSTKILVFLWLCLYQVSGLPVAKRPTATGNGDDVIAGSDFLSVYMQRSEPKRASRPSEFHSRGYAPRNKYYPRLEHDNFVIQKSPLLSPYSENYEKYNKPYSELEYESNVSQEVEKVKSTQATETTTAVDEVETTIQDDYAKIENTSTTVQDQQSTTESVKVISVKISSSVVRHAPKTSQVKENKNKETDSENTNFTVENNDSNPEEKVQKETIDFYENRENEKLDLEESQQTKETSEALPYTGGENNIVSTLVTQDQPTITAAQRNDFGVEEASHEGRSYGQFLPPKEITSYGYEHREIPGIVEEIKRIPVENRQSKNQKITLTENYHNPPEALRSVQYGAEVVSTNKYRTLSGEEYQGERNYQVNSQSIPASYQSSVSTATSDSSVQFYRQHPKGAMAESVQRTVIAPKESSTEKIEYQEKPHEEQAEKNYEVPEQVYGTPEQNYEIDESVSVVTNGRVHGVQTPQPTETTDTADKKEDNHKFGYVVEGRNYRKYRVEERTPDGFIVGEYGVVSHDDGSLRGVRYTADSNINPRLIYDALVKFLSLK